MLITFSSNISNNSIKSSTEYNRELNISRDTVSLIPRIGLYKPNGRR